ncbi:MAG TPA: carboxypeptidase regulatory-like domain-containing protein [Pyrinomonadaceae bacterium]|nr:carboxypeptidase regulatory-like domain-containing protein [Pyrinomonadaceae bacterium]
MKSFQIRRLLERVFTPLIFVSLLIATVAIPADAKGARGLATITGTVRDNKGAPLAGALIQLIREGRAVIKQTYSGRDGSFSARIPAGRYSLRAIADGFSEVLFSSVTVSPSAEIIYRFNLEPLGSGRTLVEQRADRDSAKWRLRAAQSRRSIFQANEGKDATIAEVEAAEDAANQSSEPIGERREAANKARMQGVIETYFAASANPFASSYEGVNFALALPASDRVDLVFAGQTGTGEGAPQRLEGTARVRAGDRHHLNIGAGGVRLQTLTTINGHRTRNGLGQMSVRAVDEWIVRDGVVVVFGLDYSRFLGAGNADAIVPRIGFQFDANARTRVKAAFAPGGEEAEQQSSANFEDGDVIFKQPMTRPVALVDGRAVLNRSRRLEIGVERVLDNASNLEATAFFDSVNGRGVGLMATPVSSFSGDAGAALLSVANQQGSARGLRVVYSRRLSRVWSASAGYSFGRGQKLSSNGINNPGELFSDGFFQTAAVQLSAGWSTGTHVQTVFRFSPQATVFAIDPFAGRLAVYDPSLSIQVTQDLPRFGLPVHAQAIIDARNLFDFQSSTENGETLLQLGQTRRTLRGGISVRF